MDPPGDGPGGSSAAGPVPLDCSAVPHIIDRIVYWSPLPALLVWRACNTKHREQADARIFEHIMLRYSAPEDPNSCVMLRAFRPCPSSPLTAPAAANAVERLPSPTLEHGRPYRWNPPSRIRPFGPLTVAAARDVASLLHQLSLARTVDLVVEPDFLHSYEIPIEPPIQELVRVPTVRTFCNYDVPLSADTLVVYNRLDRGDFDIYPPPGTRHLVIQLRLSPLHTLPHVVEMDIGKDIDELSLVLHPARGPVRMLPSRFPASDRFGMLYDYAADALARGARFNVVGLLPEHATLFELEHNLAFLGSQLAANPATASQSDLDLVHEAIRTHVLSGISESWLHPVWYRQAPTTRDEVDAALARIRFMTLDEWTTTVDSTLSEWPSWADDPANAFANIVS